MTAEWDAIEAPLKAWVLSLGAAPPPPPPPPTADGAIHVNSLTGDDTHNGLTAATARKTIPTIPAGTTLKLAGAFWTNLVLPANCTLTNEDPAHPAIITSAGKADMGAVTIHASNCTVDGLIIRGNTDLTKMTRAGIMLQNLASSPVRNTVIKNCDVGGFSWFAATIGDFPWAPTQGNWGANIMWEGTGGAGFDGITIESNYVHGLSGPWSIDDQGIGGFGGGINIKNVVIKNNHVENIGGGPVGLVNKAYPPMGNGIGCTAVDNTGINPDGTVATITGNHVNDCGANFYNEGGGPAGILLSDCRSVIIKGCDVSRIQPDPWTPGVDRIGYDIDNNCQDCYIDNCTATGCFNSGFLLFSNGDPNWTRNGIRNCTSTNNCWGGSMGFGEICITIPGGNPELHVTGNTTSNNRVYHGQPYQNYDQGAVGITFSGGGTFSGEISGNDLTVNVNIYGEASPLIARTNSPTFTPAVSIHNNTYRIQSGNVGFWWANAEYHSLADWQAASGKGQGDIIA